MADKSHGRRDLEQKLIARAWKDQQFLEQLRKDPKGVLEREFGTSSPGFKLPADVQVKVVEEDTKTVYVVIPAKPQAQSGTLSDRDLESVAGGRGCRWTLPTNSDSCWPC